MHGKNRIVLCYVSCTCVTMSIYFTSMYHTITTLPCPQHSPKQLWRWYLLYSLRSPLTYITKVLSKEQCNFCCALLICTSSSSTPTTVPRQSEWYLTGRTTSSKHAYIIGRAGASPPSRYAGANFNVIPRLVNSLASRLASFPCREKRAVWHSLYVL